MTGDDMRSVFRTSRSSEIGERLRQAGRVAAENPVQKEPEARPANDYLSIKGQLQARLLDTQVEEQASEQAQQRKLLVGSGDRSERIRTYNYPQGRVTDHRINLTLYKLDEILEGGLAQVVDPLINEYQADQLAALGA